MSEALIKYCSRRERGWDHESLVAGAQVIMADWCNSMLIKVKSADGKVQSLDADSIEISMAGYPVELSFENGERLRLLAPGEQERYGRFVVYPGAANLISIELRPGERKRDSDAE